MQVSIKIPTSIHSVCSSENARYALSGVLVDVWNAQAAATDGRCLAVAPIEYDGEPSDVAPVVVPAELLKTGGSKARHLELNGKATRIIPGKPSATADYVDGLFPRVRDIPAIPSNSEIASGGLIMPMSCDDKLDPWRRVKELCANMRTDVARKDCESAK